VGDEEISEAFVGGSLKHMKSFWRKVIDDDLPTLAAAMAYYCALSLAPFAVITIVVLTFLPSSLEELTAQIALVFGSPAAQMAQRLLDASTNPSSRSWVGVISILLSLVFASAMFAQLQSSLNRIFEVKPRPIRKWLLSRMLSVGLVFVLIFGLFLSSLILQIFHQAPLELFRIALLSLSAVLALKLLPARTVKWHAAIPAGVMTALLFEFGNVVLARYLEISALGSAYGATGTLMIFLLWIYYSALILLFGGEICYFLSYRKR